MFNFNRKEKGQGLVEYALILVLIAIVVIVAMQVLGDKVSDTFDTVNSGLTTDAGGGETVVTNESCSAAVSGAYATGPEHPRDCWDPGTSSGFDL